MSASPSCPLPIATTQLSRHLIRLHARLRGEVAKADTGEAPMAPLIEVQAALFGAEAVLNFLGTDFEPEAIKPVRSRTRRSPLPHGGLRREVIAALKARQDWMTYDELVDAIIHKHGFVLEGKTLRHFKQKLRDAALVLKGRGFLEAEHANEPSVNTPQRWRLSQSLRR